MSSDTNAVIYLNMMLSDSWNVLSRYFFPLFNNTCEVCRVCYIDKFNLNGIFDPLMYKLIVSLSVW